MARTEPRALVRSLTPTATTALEAAVSRGVSSRHREIMVEHLLLETLRVEGSDCDLVLRHLGRNRLRLIDNLEHVLQSFKSDSQGKPVFASTLFDWLEDSWLLASLELGATRLRTGVLLVQFIRGTARYTAETFADLDELTLDEIDKELQEVLAASGEASEAYPSEDGSTSSERRATAGPGGDGSALQKFTQSWTDKAAAGKIDPVFCRQREIRQVADILTRRRKNNPILVGEPGVGKSALVEGLALAIAAGEVPKQLSGTDVRNLDLGALQAGAGVRGEFENRLKGVINDVKSSLKPVVLFIDEAHTLIGAGGSAGSSDAANLLKPELARGELRVIAATTWSEYKKYFDKDAALERRFQPVKVDEPSVDDGIVMLRGLRPVYETAHQVVIRDEAVVAAVKFSNRFISGRQLPDKAIDVLDTAAARVRIELETKPEALVAVEEKLDRLERAHTAITRDIEAMAPRQDRADAPEALEELRTAIEEAHEQRTTLEAQWHKELQAVHDLRAARRALTDDNGVDAETRRAAVAANSQTLLAVRGDEPLVHGEVDASAVAQVISGWTGIPVGKMQSETLEAALALEDALSTRVRGQDAAVKVTAETIRMAFAGVRNPTTPIGVLLFVGPSGVGKTETALALADTLYGGERFMTTINMSEFQEKHTVSRLIGSPPGYVGYGEGGVLTEAVRQRPYSVVLLDECEKADPEVMNLFYQVFDKGVLNDGEGRTIDFRNTVIVLTSNLASAKIMELFGADEPPTADTVIDGIRPELSNHFKPALLARMQVVPFGPLDPSVMRSIAQIKLDALAQRLERAHHIQTSFDPKAIEILVRRCTDAESGARNLDHILRGSLMPVIARDLLEMMATGEQPTHLFVGVSPSDGWRIEFGEES